MDAEVRGAVDDVFLLRNAVEHVVDPVKAFGGTLSALDPGADVGFIDLGGFSYVAELL